MAQPYRNVGAIESTGALVSATDQTGAAMDYDAVNGYAQITAKASGVGASLGLRFRAVVAGVLTTLLSFAPGGTTAAFAGTVSASAIQSDVFRTGSVAGVVDVRSAGSLRFWRSDNSASIDVAYSSGILNVGGGMTLASALTVNAGGLAVNAGTTALQALTTTGSTITSTTSTGVALSVIADSLTTGSVARFWSNDGNATHSGNIVDMRNQFNAGGSADVLYIEQNDNGRGIVINHVRNQTALAVTLGSTSLQALTLNGALQLGVAFVAGAPAATGYVTMKDSTGTTYKFLVGS